MHATGYITITDQGKTMVVATVKGETNLKVESSANIYIHNPPVSIDDVKTSGLPVAIHVEGNFKGKYNFMVGNLKSKPCKIAQVVREFNGIHENNSYFIEIGSNVDIAFICFVAYAIDELFSVLLKGGAEIQ